MREFLNPMRQLLNIASEVDNAMRRQHPVVALESTVIAHGLPRPQNLQTAHRLQEIVREAGATPATIAIIDGKLSVGLNDDQINALANMRARASMIDARISWEPREEGGTVFTLTKAATANARAT